MENKETVQNDKPTPMLGRTFTKDGRGYLVSGSISLNPETAKTAIKLGYLIDNGDGTYTALPVDSS
jgi:hypothetical protein